LARAGRLHPARHDGLPFWLAMAGLVLATVVWWFLHKRNPPSTSSCSEGRSVTKMLQDKYGFDDFNQKVFAGGGAARQPALERGDRT
jgi:NADH-quinone oxidoreductase subunit L